MFTQAKVVDTYTRDGCLIGKLDPSGYNKGGGALSIFAPSVEAFIEHITRQYPNTGRSGDSNQSGGGGFQKFTNYAEAVEIFTKRPHEVVEYDPLDIDLFSGTTEGNYVEWDVTGDFLDVDLFLNGEPEHFGHNVMGNPRNAFATINIDLLMWAGIDNAAMQHRSVRIQALADWLENHNIRTQIVAYSLNNCHYTEVVIKAFGDYLNINNLAVATHTDFFRRIIFRQIEHSETFTFGYGSSISNIKPEGEGLVINVGQNPHSKETVNKGFDAVQNKIAKLIEEGVTVDTLEVKVDR